MPDTFLTINMIGMMMLPILHNNTIAAKKTTRKYESHFAKTGAKIGNMFQVRKPPRYIVSDGSTFIAQDYTEEMVPLVVDQHKQVGVEFGDDDLTLSMDDFAGRVVAPAMVPVANAVDVFVLSKFPQVWNTTGTPGSVAATDTPFLDAHVLLVNAAAEMTKPWPMIVTPRVSARLSSGLAGRFNPQSAISKLYEEGSMNSSYRSMGEALGWDFYQSQNMPAQVTGNFAGTPVVNLANQTGSTINTNGWTATTSTVLAGDNVQFDGVFAVNPITFQSIGELQNFVITANATADGSGNMALQISPALLPNAGKYTTVSASPANAATVFLYGTSTVANVANKTSPVCLGWSEDAITLACVDLALPPKNTGVDSVRVHDDDLGLSIMFTRGFDIRALSLISRFDILFGTALTRPEHMVRVQA